MCALAQASMLNKIMSKFGPRRGNSPERSGPGRKSIIVGSGIGAWDITGEKFFPKWQSAWIHASPWAKISGNVPKSAFTPSVHADNADKAPPPPQLQPALPRDRQLNAHNVRDEAFRRSHLISEEDDDLGRCGNTVSNCNVIADECDSFPCGCCGFYSFFSRNRMTTDSPHGAVNAFTALKGPEPHSSNATIADGGITTDLSRLQQVPPEMLFDSASGSHRKPVDAVDDDVDDGPTAPAAEFAPVCNTL